MLRSWVLREINSRFCSKTQWQMFLLVSGRHVGAHRGGHQHGVSIQISISLGKTFLHISPIRKIAVTWILARVFAYLPSFYFQILDLIYWTVLIFSFDLFWMAWHLKPAIVANPIIYRLVLSLSRYDIWEWKVSRLDSFWNRGTIKLGNGLLQNMSVTQHSYKVKLVTYKYKKFYFSKTYLAYGWRGKFPKTISHCKKWKIWNILCLQLLIWRQKWYFL